MIKKLSERIENYSVGFFVLFFALTIIPFLILCFFNHPDGEDISWTEYVRSLGFRSAQLVLYDTIHGRFFTSAVLCLNPLIIKSILAYKIYIFFFILLLFYALFLFINEFLGKVLSLREKLLISLSIFFLYCYGMNSISQGFYFLSGVAVSNLSIILILIFLTFYNRLKHAKTFPAKMVFFFICSFLIIAIMGCSEIGMIITLLIVTSLLILDLFVNKKMNWQLMVFLCLIAVCGFIAFSSPANQLRVAPQSHDLYYSFSNSITTLIKEISAWVLYAPFLGVTLLFIPIFSRVSKRKNANLNLFNIHPVTAFLIGFIFLFVILFLVIWGSGYIPYDRMLNFIYFVFLIVWSYNLIVLILYINKTFDFKFVRFYKYFYLASFIITALYLMKNNNVRTAYSDLVKGTAYTYDQKFNERYEFISGSNSNICGVDAIENIPKSFIQEEKIYNDPYIFQNKWYAKYFNKKYIFLKTPTSQP